MKYILIILLSATLINMHAQVSITGFVTDHSSGEPLINATIYEAKSKKIAVSNAYGFFSLTINKTIKTPYNLSVSYVGYEKSQHIIATTGDTLLHCSLIANALLKEVTVTSVRSIENRNEMSVVQIPIRQIQLLPMIAGEVDAIKAMQLMPGIKSGSEGTSTMLVRGGSHDQNLMMLDEVPLYNINHLGGFVSVFNPDAINNIKLYKGGFPARYGGRLSSVLDIRMKDGDLKKRKTNITVGIISSKFQTEGPIKKDTSSYMLSARRFMYDLISRPLTYFTNDKKSVGYTFYDVNSKFNYKFSSKNRLYVSFYIGNDKIIRKKVEKDDDQQSIMKDKTIWGNMLTAVRWNHIFNKRFFSNLTVNFTRYRYLSDFSFSNKTNTESYGTEYNFTSAINDYTLKSDFEYYIENYTIRFGSNHTFHDFTPNASSIKQEGYTSTSNNYNQYNFTAFENAFYLENELQIGDYIHANIGGRYSLYLTNAKHYGNFEPRALLRLNISHLFALKASYCKMTQYTHLLTYTSGIPSDLWIPVTSDMPPQKSNQFAVGVAKSFFNNRIEVSIEAYYKKLYELIDYQEGANPTSINQSQIIELIETGGTGQSKGIELLIQKTEGKLSGWLSYTLSRTIREFDQINNGNPYLFTHDATHDFSIAGSYALKKNLSFSISWVYLTGRAITMPDEYFQSLTFNSVNPTETPVYSETRIRTYSEKNNIRMAPYHRLDVGLSYEKMKKNRQRIWKFSIYNVYNRLNPYYYYVTSDEISDENDNPTGEYEIKTYQRSLFPFIPSVSYTIKF